MYSSIVDMSENESSKYLRMLELDAYANILAALRAQGPPTSDKLKLLKDVGMTLRIPQERCKAEIRKVILDERLNTVAYFSCGQLETADEWIKEGRRLISLMPRTAPQTIYSAIADEMADATIVSNEPVSSERKHSTSITQMQQNSLDPVKSQHFRVPDTFKIEENRKRRLYGIENSTLAQHLIGPPKISRIQQIYRQKVKTKVKEQIHSKVKQDQQEYYEYRQLHHQGRNLHQLPFQQRVQKLPLLTQPSTPSTSPKINILQNISLQPPGKEETIEQIRNEVNNFIMNKEIESTRTSPQPGCSNEYQAPKLQKQAAVNVKPNSNITYKHVASPGPSSEVQKSLKVCPTRKQLTKTIPGQKLIIVSNAQSISSSSILHRTLSIPFVKNISVKNFDKFKIVSTNTNTSNLQITSITNANTSSLTTSSAKHKVVTVRTNPTTKKVIPLSQLHALNAKGSIKMLPVGGKIITKGTVTTTPSICLINNVSTPTKSISASVVTIATELDNPDEGKQEQKAQEVTTGELLTDPDLVALCNDSNASTNLSSDSITPSIIRSTVLEDILKASGVVNSNNESYVDIENHIMQFTISQGKNEKENETEDQVIGNVDTTEAHEVESTATLNNSTFILMEKDQETETILEGLEHETDVINDLNAETGEYILETTSDCNDDTLTKLPNISHDVMEEKHLTP